MLKNITLSAQEQLIRKAREKAMKERTTLNARFREWLKNYVRIGHDNKRYTELMQTLDYCQSDGPYNREELNER